jgi:hypothetical protein
MDVRIRYADRGTLYLQKLALASPTSGCRSSGIIRSRTEATEFLVPLISISVTECKFVVGSAHD